MVTRPMAYQVAMPRSGMDNQRTILNIIARDETRLDTLSDDGMPCEMDNQPGGVRLYISADDSEMDNQAGGEIQYLEA